MRDKVLIPSERLGGIWNFNEIFRKDLEYDNIKKKQQKTKNNNQNFTLSVFLENTFLEKLQEAKITPPPPSHFRVNATSFLAISQNYPSL